MYNIPEERLRKEEIIKRSKFITTIFHAPSEKEAKTFISEIKEEFSDATHNCWAYVAGPPGDTGRVGMSDDGEPHGTAGKPILNVLLHSEIGEIAAVVTRYYGGTKLGTGGLVRAYSGCVKNAVENIKVSEKRDTIILTAAFDYSNISAVKHIISSFAGEIVKEVYNNDVRFEIELSKSDKENFIKAVTDTTSGKIEI